MSSMADADRIMYECGLEVLHPGGMEKTDEMARACGVGPATAQWPRPQTSRPLHCETSRAQFVGATRPRSVSHILSEADP